MAGVSTRAKRLFLRVMRKSAQDTGDSLYDTLMAVAEARVQASQSGKVLVGHSANGHDHSWQIPSDFNVSDASDLVSEILDRYDEASEKLVETDDIESPTDTQIFNEMMDKLRPIRSLVETHYNGRLEAEEVTS